MAQKTTATASVTVIDDTSIRPFRVDVPAETIDEMRRRIVATQWPERETVSDSSQGVQLETIQELARYWATDYDWRTCEATLNALPHFMTEIDGLQIHFIHARSKHEDALPLVINHGWPGSIIEQLKIIDRLTDPTAHGGSASDAFHVVVPSMPGYGFSAKPTGTGWGPERMGRAWDQLMTRLGYDHYVAQGGDWGAFVVDQMGLQAPKGCSRSTPTCPPPSRPTSTGRCRPATRRRPVSRRRNDAPTSSWSERSSRSSTPSTWRRARRPCTASRIHRSVWPHGSSITTMPTASLPRRWRLH